MSNRRRTARHDWHQNHQRTTNDATKGMELPASRVPNLGAKGP